MSYCSAVNRSGMMTEKHLLALWLILVGTDLLARVQAEGSLAVQVNSVANNYSCVDVSWQHADEAQYTIECNDTGTLELPPDQTSSLQRVCRDYLPYTLVQCTVTSTPGGSETGSGWTACAKPSVPTFDVMDRIAITVDVNNYYLHLYSYTIIVYNIKVDRANCGMLTDVTIRANVWTSSGFVRDKQASLNSYAEGLAVAVRDLNAVTRYQIEITVSHNGTDARYNSVVTTIEVTTDELPPGPVGNLTSSSNSPECVDLTWSMPAEPRGNITLYTVNCTVYGQQEIRENTTASQISICEFSGYQHVDCLVGAKNKFYQAWPSRTVTRTKCEHPSLPQFELSQNISVDGTGREISVHQIMVESNCKSLQQLIIELNKGNLEINSSEINSTQSSMTFSNLEAVTDYTVKVVAVNNEYQQSENSSSIRTGELAPGTPPDKFKLNFNSSCVILDWREPSEPNGVILNYMVSCLEQEKTLPANAVGHTFCGFVSAILLNCSVSANNSIGWSPAATSLGYTAPEPTEVLQPAQIKPASDVIEVKINTVSFTREDLRVQYYQFVVETIKPSMRKERDVSAIDVNKLRDAQTATTSGLNYYIAGKISDQTGETIDFPCGDNDMYEGFHNKKLETGVQYKIHYTYTVKLGDEYETYLVESPTSYELKPFPVYIIVIIVIILILMAILVTVLVLYKKNVVPLDCRRTLG